jgi:Tfp pilus assembly protein PilF
MAGGMNKKFFSLQLLIAFLAVFLAGCSSSSVGDQVKLGLWASDKNLWDEAVFRWKKALQANPNSVAAHNNLAVAYEKRGLYDEAVKEYEAALKLAPENSYVKSNYQSCKENIQPPKKEKDDQKNKNEKK